MDGSQFDRVSRLFARRRLSRRQALTQGGAALATAGLAAAGVTAGSAQEATPAPDAGAPGAANGPEMLFVQSFQSGSIVPTEGVDGRYTVTLEHGLGQTIYFSDRPDRIVGASPTPRFLDGLGFRPDNPPNAALVVETAAGETDIAVVELFSPVYDPAGPTVTYEVAVLANWEDSLELGFTAAPTDLAAVEPTFGAAHLFIDGCVDSAIKCVIKDNSGYNHDFLAGSIPSADFGGWCYEDLDLEHLDCPYTCVPCDARFPCSNAEGYMTDMCNQRFSNCYGQCVPEGF